MTITDLADYRAALVGKAPGPPVEVGFHALWERPETYQGRLVQVDGRVVRRFRQGAFGTFPPLVEVWAVDRAENKFCLVFAEPKGEIAAAPGDSIRFVGTFLRRIEYQGEDGPRLAPLIVGSRPPVATKQAPPVPASNHGLAALDWLVGLVVALLVVMVLARQHLRRPTRRELAEPAPEFVRHPLERNGPA